MDETVVKEGAEVTTDTDTTEEVTEVVEPGSKTESSQLLKSLKEEREKRRELEETLRGYQANQGEAFSDEGKLLERQIKELQARLEGKEISDAKNAVYAQNPALKDKATEFEAFLEENKGMKLETAAKAFLIENDLITAPQTRKGLERDNGGGRQLPKSGRTEAEVAELRQKNYRQYLREMKAGTLWG